MLIRFQGEHTGSIMMFGGAATELLKLMGTSGHEKGALLAEDVPAALESLERALAAMQESEAAAARAAEAAAEEAKAEGRDVPERATALGVRAAPLVALLREIVATRSYLMWGPA
ncbi:uncharacterized protein DUF1840 [Plasticicumulans lactativorans]|uniref:Uncharacterized protein DUF1840 n=1 Tax=Plasticicumulans lactativorans TaxID=1133106 RepID=A0A4R2L2K1_9GAMM|nr:DUF1840 family protein [Plasticicumulans lactativorans]TCO80704.1 uncharacterized protein DUF1840 [Plasticicumulans lactativorans]